MRAETPRRHTGAALPEPGYQVAHGASVLGTVVAVEPCGPGGVPVVYVAGGRSGALQYVVPSSAVSEVRPADRLAVLRPDVRFQPDAVSQHGTVRLIPSASAGAQPASVVEDAPRPRWWRRLGLRRPRPERRREGR